MSNHSAIVVHALLQLLQTQARQFYVFLWLQTVGLHYQYCLPLLQLFIHHYITLHLSRKECLSMFHDMLRVISQSSFN